MLSKVLNGGQRPGDATEVVLWDAFKDCALFACLALVLNPNDMGIDKEGKKAELLDRWEEQCRLDFSRQLDETRTTIDNPEVQAEFIANGLPSPNLGKVEAEFDIRLDKVKGMIIRVLDLI